jgi:hypothetical protein
MTLTSWNNRSDINASEAVYELDPVSNSVPGLTLPKPPPKPPANTTTGHTIPSDHINTVINHILPSLLNPTARTYIISVASSVTPTLQALNSTFTTNPLAVNNEATALIQPPIFDARDILTCACAPTHMAARARAWVDDKQDLGKLVCVTPMARPGFESQTPLESADEGYDGGDEGIGDDKIRAGDKGPPVCCPHFSSGKDDGVVEMVWPTVKDAVLGWFWDVREEAVKGEGLSRGIASAVERRKGAVLGKEG